MQKTSIPVNLTLEAARHVVGLSCWTEFEAMIARTTQEVPEARAISVWLDQPYLPHEEPRVLICAEVKSPGDALEGDGDPRERHLGEWAQESFSEHISRHFIPMVVRGYTDDER
jgi:hypothetical protein